MIRFFMIFFVICGLIWGDFGLGTPLQAPFGPEAASLRLLTSQKVDFGWILGPDWGAAGVLWGPLSISFDVKVASGGRVFWKPLPERVQDRFGIPKREEKLGLWEFLEMRKTL